MKFAHLQIIIFLLSLLTNAESDPATSPTTRPRRVYIEWPNWGTLGSRIEAVSRGSDAQKLPFIDVLLPDQLAGCVADSTSLFWFIAAKTNWPCEVTLSEDESRKTLIVRPLKVTEPGIQRFDLTKVEMDQLKPGRTYLWSVSLVVDRDDPEKNPAIAARFTRREASAELREKIAAASPFERANIFAQAGIWCDALSAISTAIEANPDDRELRAIRADLLEQAKLKDAADFERQALR